MGLTQSRPRQTRNNRNKGARRQRPNNNNQVPPLPYFPGKILTSQSGRLIPILLKEYRNPATSPQRRRILYRHIQGLAPGTIKARPPTNYNLTRAVLRLRGQRLQPRSR